MMACSTTARSIACRNRFRFRKHPTTLNWSHTLHKLFYVGLALVWAGGALTLAATMLRKIETPAPRILHSKDVTDEGPIILYPQSGVMKMATEIAPAANYYNDTKDEVHYIEFDNGR